MDRWGKLLKSLGFTESESSIYLLSLEMGPASVQNLARKAKVSRVTTYAVIESLSSHGLMSSMLKGKKKLYAAESPERLLSFVGQRMKTMEATFREVEQYLPDLKLLQRGEKPVVKFFEGKEGLKALINDVMQTAPKAIDEFCDRDAVVSVLDYTELHEYWDWLDKNKVYTRFMYSGTKLEKARRPAEIAQAKYIEPGTIPFNFSGDFFVYASRVVLATFKTKLIVIIIESQELADTMRAMFEFAWAGHSVLNKKNGPAEPRATQ